MSKHTLEIYELLQDKYFKLFDFEYNFYTDDEEVRAKFEQRFIDTYMFHEIGFETVVRFKHYLRTKLNNLAPYYTKLYATELASKDISFMLNKDLKETFIRTVEGQENVTENSTSTDTSNMSGSQTSDDTTTSKTSQISTQGETFTLDSTNTGNSSDESTGSTHDSTINSVTDEIGQNDTTTNNYKESSIANGLAKVGLDVNYLTGINQTDNNLTSNIDRTTDTTNTYTSENTNVVTRENTNTISNSEERNIELENTNESETSVNGNKTSEEKRTSNSEKDVTSDKIENMTETTELISQGNIGITSSAQLLKEWRSVLIDIDMMIISECESLFLKLY